MTEADPNLLYHYTTISGMHGIVRSRELWATDLRYLNDTKEFDHGIEGLEHFVRTSTSIFPTNAAHG